MNDEKDLVKKLYEEESDLNEIVDLFNLNLRKKEIARAYKLSDVQDSLVDKIYDRVENSGDEFSNRELLEYHKVIQDSLNKQNSTLEDVKIPVQINQQINVNDPTFNRESRHKILSAVSEILADVDKEGIE